MTEPLANPTVQKIADLEHKLSVVTDQVEYLEAIRQRDNLTQQQTTKLDAAIPKGKTLQQNMVNRLTQLRAQATNDDIDNAIARIQELMNSVP